MLGNAFVACGTNEGIIDVWDLRTPSSVPSMKARSIETSSDVILEIAMEECTPITALSTVTDTLFASLDARGLLEIW